MDLTNPIITFALESWNCHNRNVYAYTSVISAMLIERQVEGGIGFITLNRPEKCNALSSEMLKELYKALDFGEDVRVVVIRGKGKNFCAGHDLSEILAEPLEVKRHFELCRRVMERIRGMGQVVIAEVRGYAVAGGCQLVAACDLAVASENSKFGLPGIKLGLFCFTPTVFVSRCIGVKRAFELAFTGELIDAKKALEWGLVNRVVPDDSLERETLELARSIAKYDYDLIAEAKRFFYSQLAMETFDALNYAINTISLYSSHRAAREGIRKFLER